MSVYFARVRDYVKIGFSADPPSRMNTVTAGSCIKPDDVLYGDTVDLFGWVQGDRKVERAMHRRFAHLRVVGEWFWDDPCYETLLLDDPFAVLYHELGSDVVRLMADYPHATREQVVKACSDARAQELADPNSHTSRIARFYDAEFIERVKANCKADLAADRAYWHAQRKASA